ncbi:uroplakin-3b-like [Pelodytes ibericus]
MMLFQLRGWQRSLKNVVLQHLDDIASYIPQLTLLPVPGKLTTTTFVLDIPQCVFINNAASDVWLLVATNTAAQTLTTAMPTTPSSYSSYPTKGYFHFLPWTENKYPCSSDANFTRVGNDASCFGISFCNGPLNALQPYRVKFVVLDGTTPVIGTQWSAAITLQSDGQSPSTIDTWPGRRSGGMIVITSILSVLVAGVLSCLIAAFIAGCKGLSWSKKVQKTNVIEVPEIINMKNYKTHHVPTEQYEPQSTPTVKNI